MYRLVNTIVFSPPCLRVGNTFMTFEFLFLKYLVAMQAAHFFRPRLCDYAVTCGRWRAPKNAGFYYKRLVISSYEVRVQYTHPPRMQVFIIKGWLFLLMRCGSNTRTPQECRFLL